MATGKSKTVYVCRECGYTNAKWMGKCPSCGEWNSLEETVVYPEPSSPAAARHEGFSSGAENKAQPFDHLELPEYMRQNTGTKELDRVLGGGLVQGSVVLLAGEPGIGKSTMLLQICRNLGNASKVLYVSGEESKWQLKYRANRLGVSSPNLFVLTETNVEKILEECDRISPEYLVIDSIQTVYDSRVNSAPGSVTQVREARKKILRGLTRLDLKLAGVGMNFLEDSGSMLEQGRWFSASDFKNYTKDDQKHECTITTDSDDFSITGVGKFETKGEKNSIGGEDRDTLYIEYTVDFKKLNCKYEVMDTLVVRDRGLTPEYFTVERH